MRDLHSPGLMKLHAILLLALVVPACVDQPGVSGSWDKSDRGTQGTCYSQGFLDDRPTESVRVRVAGPQGVLFDRAFSCDAGGFSIDVPPTDHVTVEVTTEISGSARFAIDQVDHAIDLGTIRFE